MSPFRRPPLPVCRPLNVQCTITPFGQGLFPRNVSTYLHGYRVGLALGKSAFSTAQRSAHGVNRWFPFFFSDTGGMGDKSGWSAGGAVEKHTP